MKAQCIPTHPDHATLRSFLLGLLDDPTYDQVQDHLERCEVCCESSLTSAVEDDRLVRSLRLQDSERVQSVEEQEQ
jgi:hypothetical protein